METVTSAPDGIVIGAVRRLQHDPELPARLCRRRSVSGSVQIEMLYGPATWFDTIGYGGPLCA